MSNVQCPMSIICAMRCPLAPADQTPPGHLAKASPAHQSRQPLTRPVACLHGTRDMRACCDTLRCLPLPPRAPPLLMPAAFICWSCVLSSPCPAGTVSRPTIPAVTSHRITGGRPPSHPWLERDSGHAVARMPARKARLHLALSHFSGHACTVLVDHRVHLRRVKIRHGSATTFTPRRRCSTAIGIEV